MPIATPATVQAEGSLLSGSDPGAPTTEQLTAAINAAYKSMLRQFTLAEYNEATTYAGADADLLLKKECFLHAESSFAIAELTSLLNNQQLVETGFVRQKRIGESTIEFATPEERATVRGVWERKAYAWLASYLTTEILDAEAEQIGFKTKDRKFTLAAFEK